MDYGEARFTYGVELEYGNCLYGQQLPGGAKWNDQDNTCVSSTGIANDPRGVLYRYGGEINTAPTTTVSQQVDHIRDIKNALSPAPIVNYRSNLHVHVRVPGLKEDLPALQKLMSYIQAYQEQTFNIVENVPVPDPSLPPNVYKWARKRQKRRFVSHQYKVPTERLEEIQRATTPLEFFHGHAPLTEKGRMWFYAPRAGINLRQLWEPSETIEFRHFPGTLDDDEMYSCILWCKLFVLEALGSRQPPSHILQAHAFKFPKFEPYEYETEQVYQWTNFAKNSRGTVKQRLSDLRQRIDIDDLQTPSEEVFREVMAIKSPQEHGVLAMFSGG